MKTEKITLVAALFLNKFDKELQRIVSEDVKALKQKSTQQVAVSRAA